MNTAHRHIALRLHGLHARDRRWFMQRFAHEDARSIEKYLHELETFQLDEETRRAALTSAPVDHQAKSVSCLSGCDVVGLQTVLAGEPAWVVSAALEGAGHRAKSVSALTQEARNALEQAVQAKLDGLPDDGVASRAPNSVQTTDISLLGRLRKSWQR